MYKTTTEVIFNEKVYKIGEEIENPSKRMIELGLVQFVRDKPVEPIKLVGKPKRSKPSKKKPEPQEQPEQQEQVDEMVILTEDSADIQVETTE